MKKTTFFTKRRICFILGICIIVAGLCIFLYPIINSAYASYQNRKILDEIKSEILINMQNMAKENVTMTLSPTPYPADDTVINPNDNTVEDTNKVVPEASESEENSPTSFTEAPQNNKPMISDNISLDNILEEPIVEEESVLDNKRLHGQTPFGIIEIESIDLVYAIVEGTETWNIGVAIGHFSNSVGIGEEGNCALAGHRGGTSGPYFQDIYKLVIGDTIIMTNLLGEEYTYIVYDSFVVEPTDVYVVKELEETGRILTMITCTDGGTRRLVVRARCDEEEEDTQE